MRRRWKRRLFWASVLGGLALLAIPATVAQASAALSTHLQRRPPMRKLVPLAVLLVLGAVAGGATFASASSTGTTQALTLIAVDLPKSDIYVDAGPKGHGPGDTTFFREILRRNGKQAGGSEVMCVFTSRNSGRCHGTLRLGGGTLEAAGGTRFGGRFSLPVVGGTGRYAAASGVLTVVALGEKRSRYEIELAD